MVIKAIIIIQIKKSSNFFPMKQRKIHLFKSLQIFQILNYLFLLKYLPNYFYFAQILTVSSECWQFSILQKNIKTATFRVLVLVLNIDRVIWSRVSYNYGTSFKARRESKSIIYSGKQARIPGPVLTFAS